MQKGRYFIIHVYNNECTDGRPLGPENDVYLCLLRKHTDGGRLREEKRPSSQSTKQMEASEKAKCDPQTDRLNRQPVFRVQSL